MSQLIPTQRTDKNGRIVIRHMKEQPSFGDANKSLRSLSAPTLKESAEARITRLHDHFTAFVADKESVPDKEDLKSVLATLERKAPGIDKDIDRVTTSGTDTGKLLATELLVSLVFRVEMMTLGFAKETHLDLLEVWHGGNVAEEGGLIGVIDFMQQSTSLNLTTEERSRLDDAGWRGFGAHRIAFDTEDEDAPQIGGDAKEFIKWAGRQKNIGAVIRFAMERETKDINTLRELLAASEGSGVLREGAL